MRAILVSSHFHNSFHKQEPCQKIQAILCITREIQATIMKLPCEPFKRNDPKVLFISLGQCFMDARTCNKAMKKLENQVPVKWEFSLSLSSLPSTSPHTDTSLCIYHWSTLNGKWLWYFNPFLLNVHLFSSNSIVNKSLPHKSNYL